MRGCKSVDAAEVDALRAEYGSLPPARQLRYRYALTLARSGNLERFQQIYEQFYQGQGVSRLDCLSLQAEINELQRRESEGEAAREQIRFARRARWP